MDKLSLKDGRFYSERISKFKARRPECQTPRLPTPETSRSSFDGNEGSQGTGTTESIRNGFVIESSVQYRPGDRLSPNDGFYHKPVSESCNKREPAPYSPPYQASDAQRPSLPPLKMVLGDSIASPPRTPKIPSAPLQPTPREPTYNTDTYRPPSLYGNPNKKQKTEIHERMPPLNAPSGFASHSLTGYETGAKEVSAQSRIPQVNPNAYLPSQSPRFREMNGRECARSPADGIQSEFPPRAASLTSNGIVRSDSSQTRETLHQPPRLTTLDSERQATTMPTTLGARNLPKEYTNFTPSPIDSQPSYIPHERYSRVPAPSHSSHYLSPVGDSFHRIEAGDHLNCAERRRSTMHLDFGSMAYQNDRSPDGFVSGSYEYYYPKARKRSNLPKHSTEIMRAWFDQNIGNPYPSEEQKALFATATGISLTQVSNWFINHRRRCPELRDKRAERRKM